MAKTKNNSSRSRSKQAAGRPRVSNAAIATKPTFSKVGLGLVAALLGVIGIGFVLFSHAGTKPYSRLDCTSTKAYMGAKGSDAAAKKADCIDRSAEAMTARIYKAVMNKDVKDSPAEYKLRAEQYIGLRESPATEFAKILLATPSAKAGYGKKSNSDKIDWLYTAVLGRQADESGKNFWVKYLARKKSPQTIAAFVTRPEAMRTLKDTVAADLASLPADYRPEASPCKNGLNMTECRAFVRRLQDAQGQQCKGYNKGGSVVPLCKTGSPGGITDGVITRNIDGTNVSLNKALASKFKAWHKAGKQAGYDIQANDESGPGYGSYRTHDMQQRLINAGKPAAAIDTSMHQWGLAIDLSCNGKKFNDSGSGCQNWIRQNAGKFGFYNLPSESWHYSSNGK